jgi:hypothetical protein
MLVDSGGVRREILTAEWLDLAGLEVVLAGGRATGHGFHTVSVQPHEAAAISRARQTVAVLNIREKNNNNRLNKTNLPTGLPPNVTRQSHGRSTL